MKVISTCKLERQNCEIDKTQNVLNLNENPNILFRQPYWTDILLLRVLQKDGKAVLFEKLDNNVCSSWKLDFSFFTFLNRLTPIEFYAE